MVENYLDFNIISRLQNNGYFYTNNCVRSDRILLDIFGNKCGEYLIIEKKYVKIYRKYR